METAYIWFLASILFFVAEALGISGVGLLFAAIAAFCVGLGLQFGLLGESNHILQGAAFFGFTALFAVLLWKPMQKFRVSHKSETHHDVIGRTALVAGDGLVKGKTGLAQWSGTTMSAQLASDAAINSAAIGEELKIVRVDGATLVLAQLDYPLAADR